MTGETKHTPGPWEANGKSVRTKCHDASGHAPNGYEGGICNCLGARGFGKELDAVAKANAKLIAAAPELLESAKQALAWFLDHAGTPWDHDEAIIRAQQKDAAVCSLQSAIAKAKGETA